MGVHLTIGELAGWAGTTTRTIRHYHRVGVLPEPSRGANGYRVYGLPDLARLLRARRLVRLGLPLADVARLLGARDEDDLLRSTLQALDADLGRQVLELRRRRDDVRQMLDGTSSDAEGAVRRLAADLRAGLTPSAPLEREIEILQVLAHEAPEVVPRLEAAYRRVLGDEEARRLSAQATEQFEALAAAERAGRPVDDAIAALAALLADLVRRALPAQAPDAGESTGSLRLRSLALGDLTPAQRRAVELAEGQVRGR